MSAIFTSLEFTNTSNPVNNTHTSKSVLKKKKIGMKILLHSKN